MIRCVLTDKGTINTEIKSQGVAPTEAIGLLEMVKDQFVDQLRQNKKSLFDIKGDFKDEKFGR